MPFEQGGRFGMAAAYRVAAPSIRIVPRAALASCWPLPQQLLPVSATGGGRRRCTLAIFSGKIIYILPTGKICGFSRLAFSQEEPQRKVASITKIADFSARLFTVGFLRKTAFSPLTEAAVSGINKNDKGE